MLGKGIRQGVAMNGLTRETFESSSLQEHRSNTIFDCCLSEDQTTRVCTIHLLHFNSVNAVTKHEILVDQYFNRKRFVLDIT